MFIHLTNDISHLIKLSFNTPKSNRGLDALSTRQDEMRRVRLERDSLLDQYEMRY
jgi:hypothetical protein